MTAYVGRYITWNNLAHLVNPFSSYEKALTLGATIASKYILKMSNNYSLLLGALTFAGVKIYRYRKSSHESAKTKLREALALQERDRADKQRTLATDVQGLKSMLYFTKDHMERVFSSTQPASEEVRPIAAPLRVRRASLSTLGTGGSASDGEAESRTTSLARGVGVRRRDCVNYWDQKQELQRLCQRFNIGEFAIKNIWRVYSQEDQYEARLAMLIRLLPYDQRGHFQEEST